MYSPCVLAAIMNHMKIGEARKHILKAARTKPKIAMSVANAVS